MCCAGDGAPAAVGHQLTSDIDATLAALVDVDEAAVLPSPSAVVAAGQAEQSTVYAEASGMLDVDAEMAGLVSASDIKANEHVMLDLDQEMSGLLEVADKSAGQEAAHSTAPAPSFEVVVSSSEAVVALPFKQLPGRFLLADLC